MRATSSGTAPGRRGRTQAQDTSTIRTRCAHRKEEHSARYSLAIANKILNAVLRWNLEVAAHLDGSSNTTKPRGGHAEFVRDIRINATSSWREFGCWQQVLPTVITVGCGPTTANRYSRDSEEAFQRLRHSITP